jgi:hypothetical protein
VSISTLGWIVVGVTAWLVVAVVVALLIGRVIRARDEQVPRDDLPPPADAPDDVGSQRPQSPPPWSAARSRQRPH